MYTKTYDNHELFERQSSYLQSIGIVKVSDIFHQVLHAASSLTVLPLPAVSNAADLIVESDCTAGSDVCCLAALEAVLEQVECNGTIIVSCAAIDLGHVNSMLQSAVLDKSPLGNVCIFSGKAHRESKIDLWVWIQFGST